MVALLFLLVQVRSRQQPLIRSLPLTRPASYFWLTALVLKTTAIRSVPLTKKIAPMAILPNHLG